MPVFATIPTMQQRVANPESIEQIADRLRRTRESTNLNQAAWCRLVGISQQAWNNYEWARRRINIDDAFKVCRTTGVSLDWIYRGITAGLPINLATTLQTVRKGRSS